MEDPVYRERNKIKEYYEDVSLGEYSSSLPIKKKTNTYSELNYLSLISNDSSDTESSFSFKSEDMEIDAEMKKMKVKKEYIKSQLDRFQKIAKKIELEK